VDRFVNEHSDEVRRGSRFSQLSGEEREDIIRKARRLARHGACPSEISKRLSRTFDRSPETIRYTLRQYDEQHPENAVFPNASTPLSETRKREIYQRRRSLNAGASSLTSVRGRLETSGRVADAETRLPSKPPGTR
jgi:hypothetical protein